MDSSENKKLEPPPNQSKRKLEEPADPVVAFKLPCAGAVAGAVLKHCQAEMEKLISAQKPLIFKVGVTHCEVWRWHNRIYGYKHSVERWSNMLVLWISNEPAGPCMLEAALIHQFKGI